MNCQGQRTLYLKANGSLVCEDDAGEQVEFARIGEDCKIDLRDVIDSPRMRHLRESMIRDVAPWPLVCTNCAFFRPDEPYGMTFANGYMQKLQVETTLACKLRCSGCSGFWQVKNRPSPVVLSLDRYEAMLHACVEAKVQPAWIEYCGQGEPLNHRDFPKFMAATSRILPATRQRVITNGNHDFDERFPNELPDEILVSGDGLYQQSYEQYRTNGDVAMVLAFLKRAAERARAERNKSVVWKYIVFAHNDSDEELIAAQHLAKEIGVSRLLFVLTHTGNKSKRFTPFSSERIPIVEDVAVYNFTPVLYREEAPSADDLMSEEMSPADPNDGYLFSVTVDDITGDDASTQLRGWAIGNYGAIPEKLWVTDRSGRRHELQLGFERPDVAAAFPQWETPDTGFEGTIAMPLEEVKAAHFGAIILGRELVAPVTRPELQPDESPAEPPPAEPLPRWKRAIRRLEATMRGLLRPRIAAVSMPRDAS
jgi:hypothetical protein